MGGESFLYLVFGDFYIIGELVSEVECYLN